MSTASIRRSTSGCAERIAQAMEYTSAPLLGPRIAIFTARSFPFDVERRPISSSSGRFRRKKVPRYIRRSCRRTSEWTRWPNEWTGRRVLTDRGRRSHTHSFRRRYAPTGDLPRIRKDRKSTRLNSSHVEISYAVFCLKKKKKKKDTNKEQE